MTSAFRRASFVALALAFVAGAWLSFSPAVHAQVTEGLTAVGQTVRLSSADPRVIAARIINVALGLLSIIFLGLTVYAGFLWMTSGGSADGAEKARTLLRNAVIGLIIILSSWAITRYVISRLLDATNGGGGGSVVDDGGAGGGGFGAGGAFSSFQLRSITPVGSVPIRNIRVHFVFSRNVDPAMASSTIHVYRAAGRVPVDGTFTVSGAVVEFTPVAVCPTAPTERCLDGDTDFIAAVDRTLRSQATPGESSQRIVCGGFALACEASFHTGNLIDTLPPTATIQIPYDGQSIPQDDTIGVSTRAVDDVAISYVSSSVNAADIGVDAPTSTVAAFTAAIDWSTRGASTGTYSLRSQARDLSGHFGLSGALSLVIRPPHCSDRRQNEDEAAIDCGGRDCATCVPGAVGPIRPAHCSNGTRDADEAAIDCGGADCAVCVAGPGGPGSTGPGGSVPSTTLPAHCSNGTRDADEAAIDCGGRDCRTCIPAPGSSGPGGTSIVIRPPSAFDGVRSPGETGIDCGGPSAGACPGAPCRSSTDCRSGVCRAGVCVEQPIILTVSPNNGRPGTLVTITGANFGTARGQVRFWDGSAFTRLATAPAACAPEATWRSGQIIVQVPTGAVTGPIQVTNASARLSDATNDTNGPVLDNFTVNTVAHPGLCAVTPITGERGDVMTFTGVGLGTTGRVLFGTDRDVTPPSFVTPWSDARVAMNVPVVPAATYPVHVRVAGQDSNSVSFTVTERVRANPVISGVDPITGPIGEYVTLAGRNFGTAVGRVVFRNVRTGEVGSADDTLPAACTRDFWRDTNITIKVPRGIGLGATSPVTPDSYEIFVRRQADGLESNRVAFTVNTDVPRPGICAVTPIAGPVGTVVSLSGERFGGRTDTLTFQGSAATARVRAGGVSSWADGLITASVPTGAYTGPVRVTVGASNSNGVGFAVRNCNEDASICGAESCCHDTGACSVRGVCAEVAASSMYGWELSTGRLPIYPQVLEECPGPSGLPPSPSPWNGRPGGNAVCVNAEVVIRFNTGIDRTSLRVTGTSPTIIVSRCTAAGSDPCATKVRVRGTIEIDDSDGTPGSHRTMVAFSPEGEGVGSNWVASTTYDVVLTTGVTSDGRIGMRALPSCGAGNGYCFRFQTRRSTDLCRIGSVGVTPNPFTATDIDEVIEPYRGNILSAEDVCIQMNPAGASWTWYTGRTPSVPDARASISTYAGRECVRPGGVCPWLRRVTARNETGPDDPVRINAEASNPGERPAVGTSPLYIQFVPPRVTSYGPNCNEACSEAMIWAEFNVPMDPVYVSTRQVLLYKCANENCRSFSPSTPLVLGAGSATLVDSRTPSLARPANRRLEIRPIDGLGFSYLEPGAFYKVILVADTDPSRRLGFRSRTGLALTGLNDRQGFAWRFRVKSSNGGLCDVTRVDVLPLEKVETVVAARQLFAAAPVSVSEVCGEQYLMDSSSPYAWTSATLDVSKFINARGDGLMSYARVLAPNCSGRCLNLGSEGVDGRIASCGNSIVETTDALTCRRPSGAACTPVDTDCITRTDVSERCRVLPPGAQGGEECDLGNASTGGLNGVRGSACGVNCLWTGVDGGTCGNSAVDVGEECDPGRVCVGGTAVGVSCVRDDVCTGGGRCLVNTVGTGCSDRCLALGSSSVTAVGEDSHCGNGSIGAGEMCDDGNIVAGDGCSPDCLHEGSHTVVAVCGNTVRESGESCEKDLDGAWPRGCDRTTCLHQGMVACPAPGGDPLLRVGCCGNGGAPEAGEDCDDGNVLNGDGCSSRCLAEGSSIGYRPAPSVCGDTVRGVGEQCEASGATVVGGRQVSEIVGEHEPDTSGRMMSRLSAVYRSKTGQADHGLQCGFRHEIECVGDPSEGRTITSHGLTGSGCCMERPTLTSVRFPLPSSTNVCRNTEISFNFTQVMDEDSIRRNLEIGEEVTGACPVGTTTSTGAAYTHTCVGQVVGTVHVEPSGRGTRAVFSLTRALKATTQYRIIVRGDGNLLDDVRVGVRNARGVLMAGDGSWTFTTNDRICLANDIVIRDTNPDHPFLFQRPNESHLYTGSVVSMQAGVVVPISSVEEYGWTWQPWLSSRAPILTTSAMAVMTADETASQRTSTSTVQAQNRTGSSLIFAGITIARDTVSIPSTVGQTRENSHIATVAICERPWPYADERYGGAMLFSDSRPQFSEPSVLTGTIFEAGPYFNVASMYCLDAGRSGTSTDDLPPLTIRPTPPSTSDVYRGILRQYLFTFEGTEVPAVFRKDAIGMRVFANPLHLSPRAWYLAQGFLGTPASTSIDGYEAIRDGDNLYVGAPNVDASTAGPVTSTIYLLSHNPDAERQTKLIFKQLVDNLFFNVNIQQDSSNVCKNGTTVFEDERHHVVPCTSDWECAAKNTSLHCASFKAKIQRDVQRLADFQGLMSKLEGAYARDGRYPTIGDGSYLQGLTNSRWGSWQSVLGSALEGDMPIDPVNRFLTCGRCKYTDSSVVGEPCVDGADCRAGGTCAGVPRAPGSPAVYDPSTCWEVTNRRFICPRLPSGPSRFYQYRSLGSGTGYELGTELEAASYDRYRPTLVTGLRRCTNTGQLCQVDDQCTTYYPGTVRVRSSGRCQPTGGQWRYTNICTGREFGIDAVCGNGIRSTAEACEVGDTATASCTTADGRPGMKQQVCATDCQRFTDGPSTRCIPLGLCGNGRVDHYLCNGPGVKYGQSCSTLTASTEASSECSDPRDPPGSITACVSISSIPSAGSEETCDDGSLNGTYGHCNRTCTGYDARCGDGQLSIGETCDAADLNGQYCDTRSTIEGGAGCIVGDSCGFDCRSRAPFCGDGLVQEGSGEQCERGQSHTTTDAICTSGPFAYVKSCQTSVDCSTPGTTDGFCGHVGSVAPGVHASENACTGYLASRCIGYGSICQQGDRRRCASDTDCEAAGAGGRCVPRAQVDCSSNTACGIGGRCNTYPTQRVQACGPAPAVWPLVQPIAQCKWNRWSECLPASSCGDGVIDSGEICDDGNDVDNDACTTLCQANVCGDGYLNVGAEQCDYGDVARAGRNGLPCSSEYGATCATCTTSCRVEAQSGGFCGDGLRNGREQCDFVGACVGGPAVGARCTSDAVCGTGGRCSYPGVASDSTCRGIGYDYANNSICNTNAYITEPSGGGVVCVRTDPTSDECATCPLTVGAMSRPSRVVARLADSGRGGPAPVADPIFGRGGTGADIIYLYRPGSIDVTTPGGFGTRTTQGAMIDGICRACRGGSCVYHAPEVGTRVTLATQSACVPGTVHDYLTCGTSCGLSGCGSCLTAPTSENAVTIEGRIYDSFAQVPIPGARVILTYRGNQIADTVADDQGGFRIPNLHGRRECGQYRLTVSQERDNSRTPAIERYGYRSFDSGAFSPVDFLTRVTVGGRIELVPRTGEGDVGASGGGLLENETRVIVTWDGSLPTFSLTGESAGRYVRAILPHIILPESRRFHKGPPTTVGGTLACPVSNGWASCAMYQPGGEFADVRIVDRTMLCSDNVNTFSSVTGRFYSSKFACGYLFATGPGGLHLSVDPLAIATTNDQAGQTALLCAPRFETPDHRLLGITPEGTTAIRTYLERTGQAVNDASMAARLALASCRDDLVLGGATILGYATSTACTAAAAAVPARDGLPARAAVVAEPACAANASPSNYCCRRDIGSGATWQGSNNILVSPGAVAICKPHLITTESVCSAQRALSVSAGGGATGPLTNLACNPNSTCDEFVREAPVSDPMRLRYLRSLRDGDTYSFYLEQAHYAEAELGPGSGTTYRCYAGSTRAPGDPEYTTGACSGIYLQVLCDGVLPCRDVTTPETLRAITCTGMTVDTCRTSLNATSYRTQVTITTPASDVRASLSTPARLFTDIGLQVEVLSGTERRIIRPGAGRVCDNRISAYLWHAFDQNARTGEITIAGGGVGEWVCDAPEGITGLNRPITNNAYFYPGSLPWPPPDLGLPADPPRP